MGRVPFTMFGKTKLVPLKTWSNGKMDKPAKDKWDADLWVERGEDWYALSSPQLRNKTVLIVQREDWLDAPDMPDRRDG